MKVCWFLISENKDIFQYSTVYGQRKPDTAFLMKKKEVMYAAISTLLSALSSSRRSPVGLEMQAGSILELRFSLIPSHVSNK